VKQGISIQAHDIKLDDEGQVTAMEDGCPNSQVEFGDSEADIFKDEAQTQDQLQYHQGRFVTRTHELQENKLLNCHTNDEYLLCRDQSLKTKLSMLREEEDAKLCLTLQQLFPSNNK
jgi:hypothetical protein